MSVIRGPGIGDDLSGVDVIGVDFTSAPSRSKPITVAFGTVSRSKRDRFYSLAVVRELETFEQFEGFLSADGNWVGGFDLPFGQPRTLIEHEGWPTEWTAFVRFFCAARRERLRETFRRYCHARPAGDKFAWRKADKPAGSSPAMRWTNPPVAWMMQAGIGRMLEAGLVFPAHHHPSADVALVPPRGGRAAGGRIALEAYPGFTARKVTRASYKSDAPALWTPQRRRARSEIIGALVAGRAGLSLRLDLTRAWRRRLLGDGSGDLLDAVIAAMQAGHAALLPRFGLPSDVDPLEGWIAAVPPPSDAVPPPIDAVPLPSDAVPPPSDAVRQPGTPVDGPTRKPPGKPTARAPAVEPGDHPVVRPLLEWFDREQRPLPWRRNRDPYRVWVSEIMLQQTQVARVKEFFGRFIRRFPSVAALATARESDVLAAWEGLGYYRRARQMHAAARRIVADLGGEFPRSTQDLRRLPGIGRYTAAAIASIAFDLPEPIVEANSRRVIARLAGHGRRLDVAGGDEPIWRFAAAMVPVRKAGLFNQALMDLGATVCTHERPRCESCPLRAVCVARQTGRVGRIPAKAGRVKTLERHEAAVVELRRGRVRLCQRQEGEWWAGLWDFPRAKVRSRRAAAALGEHLGTIRHSVTRHRITLEVIRVAAGAAVGRTGRSAKAATRWVPVESLGDLPLPSPARRIARMLSGEPA